MTEFLKRLWFCVLRDEHDWEYINFRTEDEGMTHRHSLKFYRCQRYRCHAVGWPLVSKDMP